MKTYGQRKIVDGMRTYPMFKTGLEEASGYYHCPYCGADDRRLVEEFYWTQHGLFESVLVCSAFLCLACEQRFSVLDCVELD